MQIIPIIICVLITGLLVVLLSKFKIDQKLGIGLKVLTLALILKVGGNFTQQALYTYYYTDRSTADIYRFFDDGVILSNVAFSKPSDYINILFNTHETSDGYKEKYFEEMNSWIKPYDVGFYNDNHFMIKLNSVLNFISFNTYEINSYTISILALIGTILIIVSLVNRTYRSQALLGTLLIPSTNLWLVGNLKETVALIGLGTMLWSFYAQNSKIFIRIGSFIIGALILTSVKLYIILALTPVILTFFIVKTLRNKLSVYYTSLVICALLAHYLLSLIGFDFVEQLAQKQSNFINHMQESQAGSSFQISRIDDTLSSLILHSPSAIINVLFRPLLPRNAAEVLLLFENIIVWSLTCFAIWKFLKEYFLTNQLRKTSWILPFTLISVVIIGVTTPVFGAIMRYRAPYILIIVISLAPYYQSIFKRIHS